MEPSVSKACAPRLHYSPSSLHFLRLVLFTELVKSWRIYAEDWVIKMPSSEDAQTNAHKWSSSFSALYASNISLSLSGFYFSHSSMYVDNLWFKILFHTHTHICFPLKSVLFPWPAQIPVDGWWACQVFLLSMQWMEKCSSPLFPFLHILGGKEGNLASRGIWLYLLFQIGNMKRVP